MSLAWNLILPDKKQQEQLNERLAHFRKPFLTIITVLCIFLAGGTVVNRIVNKRWETREENIQSIYGTTQCMMIAVGTLAMILRPKRSTLIFLIVRSLLCLFMVHFQYHNFHGKEYCDEPAPVQIKHFKVLAATRQFIVNIYLLTSIFFTPFGNNFFTIWAMSSLFFKVEMIVINIYF
jgi:hypothetical protein